MNRGLAARVEASLTRLHVPARHTPACMCLHVPCRHMQAPSLWPRLFDVENFDLKQEAAIGRNAPCRKSCWGAHVSICAKGR